MRSFRTAAVVAAAALLATSCTDGDTDDATDDASSDPVALEEVELVVATHDDAIDALMDASSTSWRWSANMALDLTENDYELLAEEGGMSERDIDELREAADIMDQFLLHGATAEDGSSQLAVAHDGRDIVDIRAFIDDLDAGNLSDFELELLLRIDLPYILDTWFEDDLPEGDVEQELDMLREEAAVMLDEPFLGLALAVIEGDWAGLTGVIDLDEFGLTEEELDALGNELQNEGVWPSDPEDIRELLNDAFTIRDFDSVGDDGSSSATIDVHPRSTVDYLNETLNMAAGVNPDDPLLDDIPDVIEGVGVVTFDADGHLTGLSVDIIGVATSTLESLLAEHDADSAEADENGNSNGASEEGEHASDDGRPGPHSDPRDPTEEMQEALDGLRQVEGSFTFEWTFSDHGAVDTVVDVDDAVTVNWDDLEEILEEMFLAPGFDDPGFAQPGGEVPINVQSELTNLAIAQEMYWTSNSEYTADIGALTDEGVYMPMEGSGVAITIVDADETYFCIEAVEETTGDTFVMASDVFFVEGPGATC